MLHVPPCCLVLCHDAFAAVGNQNPAAAYTRPMQMFVCRASHLLHSLFQHLLLRVPLTRTVPDGPVLPPRLCR
jgi:hypothetical protein